MATAIPAPAGVTARARSFARRATDTVRTTVRSLPREAVPELLGSVKRLRKVRTPRQAIEAFETETEHLLTKVAPILVRHPLPVRSTKAAKTILASAGGLAAAGQEAEAISAFMTGGATVPPTLPLVLAGNLMALAVEIYVAASLRVHDLRDAGIEPDPHDIACDVILAMTGHQDAPGDRSITKQVVRSITKRMLSRWGGSLVPVAGIAYSGWDAQRTVDAIRALPVQRELATSDS